jgi:predicted transcriptional regulator
VSNRTETMAFRMSSELCQRLRKLAHLRSLATDKQISPSMLLRQAVERFLQAEAEADR